MDLRRYRMRVWSPRAQQGTIVGWWINLPFAGSCTRNFPVADEHDMVDMRNGQVLGKTYMKPVIYDTSDMTMALNVKRAWDPADFRRRWLS